MKRLTSLSLILMALTGAASCVTTDSTLTHILEKYETPQHGWTRPSGRMMENPRKADKLSLENGHRLYEINCAPCHGAKGRGDGVLATSLKTSPQNLSEMKGDRSAHHIYLQISLGEGAMPASNDLSENDRWDIVNYVHSLSISN